MFMEALCVTAPNGDQSLCLSTGEWLYTLYMTEYCSAIKRNELMIHTTTWFFFFF